MNRLPEEIFKRIVYNLDFKDKLTCIAVCRRWHRLLRWTILFDSFVLKGDVKFIMNQFNIRKNSREQVTSLLIDNCSFDKTTLLLPAQLLPNLKRLTWNDTRPEISTPTLQNKRMFRLYKWEFLEYLNADAFWLYTLDFLASLFANLTTLCVEFMRVQEDQQHRQILTYFIQNFKNLPALRELELYNTNVSLMDMEEIHVRAPHLESLALIDVFLYTKKDVTLPVIKEGGTTISASYEMRSFKLTTINNDVNFYEGKSEQVNVVQWLMYFDWKYRDLTTFLITTPMELRALSSIYTLEQPILDTVPNMLNISSYAMALCPMTFLLLHAMDMNNIELRSLQLWVDKINIEDIINAFEMTDQRNHVKLLTITTSRCTESRMKDMDYNHCLIQLIQQFDNVKEVYVKYDPLVADDTALSILLLRKFHESKYLRIGEYEIKGIYITIAVLNGLYTKLLDIEVNCFKLGNHKTVDEVLENILCAYRYFKIFKVHGNIYCGLGHITLPFKNNSQLQFVDIDLDGLEKYRIKRGKKEKRAEFWNTYENKILIDSSLDVDLMFYINFYWRLEKSGFYITKKSSKHSKRRREE